MEKEENDDETIHYKDLVVLNKTKQKALAKTLTILAHAADSSPYWELPSNRHWTTTTELANSVLELCGIDARIVADSEEDCPCENDEEACPCSPCCYGASEAPR